MELSLVERRAHNPKVVGSNPSSRNQIQDSVIVIYHNPQAVDGCAARIKSRAPQPILFVNMRH